MTTVLKYFIHINILYLIVAFLKRVQKLLRLGVALGLSALCKPAVNTVAVNKSRSHICHTPHELGVLLNCGIAEQYKAYSRSDHAHKYHRRDKYEHYLRTNRDPAAADMSESILRLFAHRALHPAAEAEHIF